MGMEYILNSDPVRSPFWKACTVTGRAFGVGQATVPFCFVTAACVNHLCDLGRCPVLHRVGLVTLT